MAQHTPPPQRPDRFRGPFATLRAVLHSTATRVATYIGSILSVRQYENRYYDDAYTIFRARDPNPGTDEEYTLNDITLSSQDREALAQRLYRLHIRRSMPTLETEEEMFSVFPRWEDLEPMERDTYVGLATDGCAQNLTLENVREHLDSARENGEDFADETDDQIANDMVAYSSDFESLNPLNQRVLVYLIGIARKEPTP